MSEPTPAKKPRAPKVNRLTPDALREVNARRNQAGNQPRTERVDRILAGRLVRHGWKLFAPDGSQWTSTEDYDKKTPKKIDTQRL